VCGFLVESYARAYNGAVSAGSSRLEGGRVDDEPVTDVGGEHTLVAGVDVACCDEFDLGMLPIEEAAYRSAGCP
jgi:hypothetical protein